MSFPTQCFEILCIQCQEVMRDCYCNNALFICGIYKPTIPENIKIHKKFKYGANKIRGCTTIIITDKYNLNFLKAFNFILWETPYQLQKYIYIIEYPNTGEKSTLLQNNLSNISGIIPGKFIDLILTNTPLSQFGKYNFINEEKECYLTDKNSMIMNSDDFEGATIDFYEL
jgi:hypothetical protein